MCSVLFIDSDQFSIDRFNYCANCYYFVKKKCGKIPNTTIRELQEFPFRIMAADFFQTSALRSGFIST